MSFLWIPEYSSEAVKEVWKYPELNQSKRSNIFQSYKLTKLQNLEIKF
jgi:hypothetical protein